ncbi:hypothetical protein SAMN02745962_02594 [Pseudomonas sp. LAIL14HWK12:I11]|nr:hypothetical protein SAMN02745962_02594 [Pseudomonas sp. LAIL14HWK12:I11]SMR74131.1 hypothetical protein SAMN05661028_01816 [Pseudomonas sp. LAIL14HWK12:I10]SOD03782.1 hypothetical protein SAMN05660296_02599 [Pseudomonas sp. LAIL14HWK12:I8]
MSGLEMRGSGGMNDRKKLYVLTLTVWAGDGILTYHKFSPLRW